MAAMNVRAAFAMCGAPCARCDLSGFSLGQRATPRASAGPATCIALCYLQNAVAVENGAIQTAREEARSTKEGRFTMADVHGKFVWHELLSTDPQAVAPFYSRVLGWKIQTWDKDSSYTLWLGSKGPAAGASRQSDSSPPHWLSYTDVPDIGAAVATAQRLGGRVVKGVTPIPDGGQYAILVDPQGAHFGVFMASANAPSGGPMTSEFSWHELATSDYTAALRFYRELFGWEQVATHDMGANMGMYVLFGRDGQQLGGMFNRSASMPGEPSWLAYANVGDAAKAADAAKSSGGRVLNGPHEVPGGSWIVQMLDPLGAMIAVVEPPRPAAAKPADKPADKPKAAAKVPSAPGATPAAKPPAPKAAAPAPAAKPSAPLPKPSTPAVKPSAPAPTRPPQAAKPAAPAPKKASKKVAKKAVQKAAKKVAKKPTKVKRPKKAKGPKKAKRAVKAKGAISRARAAVKRVVRRVMRKKKSARGRRRR
jgi:predicted enzyme related to lactoylglutathione lyase